MIVAGGSFDVPPWVWRQLGRRGAMRGDANSAAKVDSLPLGNDESKGSQPHERKVKEKEKPAGQSHTSSGHGRVGHQSGHPESVSDGTITVHN
ncbi:hypothetical protein N7478_006117 [Penicillium angulare]|uniref:uncharacterized protein n=1 Tax=Penicillium angulare TaxID=116970 RepID=UPI002540AF04|nr:uncharacterized protein N7478_006117 [Penicillium angulare]KAJ5280745.1 hypothetical protein N7478_006117 [Penicillium angulare]